jgi:NADH-quinone oxidoreductase subunit M
LEIEGPTISSILLAGVSLKTGFFIHLYFICYIPYTYLYIIIIILFIGIVFNCLNVFYQIDSKRWIANYSIIHMNLYYLLLIILKKEALEATTYNHNVSMFILMILVYGMIGHSIISGGLFLIIGYIYDITNTRNLLSFSFKVISSSCYYILFILLLANSSLPLTTLFLYEFISFMLVTHFNLVLSFVLLTLSCTNLLSSLYVFSKYFYQQIQYHSFDLLLCFLSLPLLVFIFSNHSHYLIII